MNDSSKKRILKSFLVYDDRGSNSELNRWFEDCMIRDCKVESITNINNNTLLVIVSRNI